MGGLLEELRFISSRRFTSWEFQLTMFWSNLQTAVKLLKSFRALPAVGFQVEK